MPWEPTQRGLARLLKAIHHVIYFFRAIFFTHVLWALSSISDEVPRSYPKYCSHVSQNSESNYAE